MTKQEKEYIFRTLEESLSLASRAYMNLKMANDDKQSLYVDLAYDDILKASTHLSDAMNIVRYREIW